VHHRSHSHHTGISISLSSGKGSEHKQLKKRKKGKKYEIENHGNNAQSSLVKNSLNTHNFEHFGSFGFLCRFVCFKLGK